VIIDKPVFQLASFVEATSPVISPAEGVPTSADDVEAVNFI